MSPTNRKRNNGAYEMWIKQRRVPEFGGDLDLKRLGVRQDLVFQTDLQMMLERVESKFVLLRSQIPARAM